MPTISVTSQSVGDVTADVLVLPVLTGADGADASVPASPELSAAAVAIGATGSREQLHRLPALPALGLAGTGSVVLVGVGAPSLADASAEDLRRAYGAATRSLTGIASAAIAAPGADAASLAAAIEGAAIGAYSFIAHRSEASDPKPALAALEVLAGDVPEPEAAASASRAAVLAEAVAIARDLVNTPPNLLFPASFAVRAQELVADLPIEIEVLDETALLEGGYGGIMGVGQGSARPPRLVRLSYSPAASTQHVALVGKGITFDTGGISLKPGAGMDEMTSDMAGAATVLAATVAAARLGVETKVTTFLAIAENMPGGGAQRPGDVVTMRNGRTVEVLNTDAEGRMVMADALVDAVAAQPDLVMDVATLTGAAVVALGTRTAGVLGTEQGRSAVLEAAERTGEPFWPLPFPEELRATLNGRVADLRNIGERPGGALSAGVFLSEFVGETEWAHLDIAGPAFASSAAGYSGKGATGMSVRTVLQVIEDRAS
ncbi:leucyl aminopeptidase [Brachybacterium hainanense]|uniref:Probable cytosol aminopeptidase n=1 Tax=Brachybacterium hainanense TaxID=1541174 RepID=A0ABV6RE98_9MICO